MLYRGMERAALDAAYNNTAAVGQTKRDAYVADWTRRSDAIRTTPGARLDLRYGATAPVTDSTSSPAARRARRRSPTSTAATGR